MSKPHKHAELIKAWADGAEIQRYTKVLSGSAKGGTVEWIWVSSPKPSWKETDEYRIKPKEKQKVKMWQWVIYDGAACNITMTRRFFQDEQELRTVIWEEDKIIQRADWTEIEVEVDDERD